MQKIFRSRTRRELKSNWIQYVSLMLLIVFGMFLIVGIIGGSESVIRGVHKNSDEYNIEDGNFSVFVPLERNVKEYLKDEGIILEELFYMDYLLEDGSSVRIYKDREKINLLNVRAGKSATKSREVVLEKNYARDHNLYTGDHITIGGIEFEISGIGTTSDYDTVLKDLTDSSADGNHFGTVFVTDSQYEQLKSQGKFEKSEHYNYGYLLSGGMSDDDLKDYLTGLEFDEHEVKDPFFIEMLNEEETDKNDLKDGISDLRDGTENLKDGLGNLAKYNKTILDGTDAIVASYLDNANEQLKDLGYNKTLTEDNYKTVFSSLMRNNNVLHKLSPVLSSLNGIKTYKDSVNDYTGKVDSLGISEISSYSKALRAGAAKILNANLQQVSAQLNQMGAKRTLTENNYQSVLKELKGSEGDKIIKKQLKKAEDGISQLIEYKNGIVEYTDAVNKLKDGSGELLSGVDKLKKNTDELLDEYFDVDVDNLTEFVKNGDNPRIEGSVDDLLINKYVGIMAGIIVMVLFTFVISVFVVHGIEKDLQVIGTFYALGVKKKQLIRHYLALPIVIAGVGGIIGSYLGFTPTGYSLFVAESQDYYSIPEIAHIYPLYLIIYGILMPPLVAAVVNILVINRKLSEPALRLLKGDIDKVRVSRLKLKRFGYIRSFQIRQFLREKRSSFAVVFGMFISLLILFLGLNGQAFCNNLIDYNYRDASYEYMYTLKYPPKTVPDGGEPCYTETLRKEIHGQNMEIALIGIDSDNPYYSFKVQSGKDKITISDAVVSKYKLKKNDEVVFKDEVNKLNYAFEVDKIVPYSIGMCIFMDIDSMRDLFNKDDDFYNVLLSDNELDLESGRLYGTVTKDGIKKSAQVFIENMQQLVTIMMGASIIIFIIVMYLMMRVMIDRSAHNISLMKVFGYRKKEIKKLYLDGNFVLIVVAALICIPLAKLFVNFLYPYITSNVAVGTYLTIDITIFFLVYAGIILCYVLINILLVRNINRANPHEALKNRE